MARRRRRALTSSRRSEAWRIPHRVPLPWGYVVRVIEVPEKSDELYDDEADTYGDGTWDVNARAIYLNKAATAARRRWVFVHEMDHAWADWKEHHVFQSGRVTP